MEAMMGECEYRVMREGADAERYVAGVIEMMRGLYAEDEAASKVDEAKFPATIQAFLTQPERGRVELFLHGEDLVGYALVVPYWSNEFGGVIAFLDEMYVKPGARGRGIGREMFAYLKRTKPFDAVAVWLEVSPKNVRARAMYELVGLRERRNSVLVARIEDILV